MGKRKEKKRKENKRVGIPWLGTSDDKQSLANGINGNSIPFFKPYQ